MPIQQAAPDGPPEISVSNRDGEIENAGIAAPAKKVYIALGKDVKENKNNLLWCLQAFPGAKIVILHIHQLSDVAPGPFGGMVLVSALKPAELRAFRQLESNDTMRSINEYLSLCAQRKIEADHLVWKSEGDVEKGIVEVISHHEIAKLVMGAAADRSYKKKMNAPTSKKAKYVDRYALPSCHITFVCKGNHIYTREPYANQNVLLSSNSSPALRSNTPGSTPHRSPSDIPSHGRSGFSRLFNRRSQDSGTPETFSRTSSRSSESTSIGSFEEVAGFSGSSGATSKTDDRREQVESGTLRSQVAGHGVEERQPLKLGTEQCGITLPVAVDEEEDYQKEAEGFHERLKKAMEEAQNLREEAFKESHRRQKAEQEAAEAQLKIRLAEIALQKEHRQRNDIEAVLSKERQILEKIEKQLENAETKVKELKKEKASLSVEMDDSEDRLHHALEKLRVAQMSVADVEREKLEIQKQRDEALQKVEEISRRQGEDARQKRRMQSFTMFSLEELMKATNNFDPNSRIGEGGSGIVYKGRVRYILVAIKVLNGQGKQQMSEFNQEVEVLSKMRHPHLITLIGACLESRALVYEYLSNGSLLDRLQSKNSTPLTWQTRTRILAEVCSALLFLHSAGVVHGDLKPGNILLDGNLNAKIGDFGISRLMPEYNTTMSMCINTDPKGTLAYMDPEFLATGDLTPKSDVYSFGVIILQLLTGRPPLWIAKIVQEAQTAGNLQELIDPDAGEWPFIQATQLANIGLKCCTMSKSLRANLETEVWRMLDAMRASLSSSPSAQSTSNDSMEAPAYFICPISQDIMSDPHVAADGFTYEAEAIRGWLDGGHSTSPMTNLKLSHFNLTPNHALHSAIEEWRMHV